MKILITGGSGKLAQEIKNQNFEHEIILLDKNELDVTSYESVYDAIHSHSPDAIIHAAALTKPMCLHDKDIEKSIMINIVGTSNMVMVAKKLGDIKLIYISTDYVYPKNTFNNSENKPLSPINNYGWSKLGGECAVKLYENSLIIRTTFMDRPFIWDTAYSNQYRSLLYIDEAAKAILSVINEKGVLNIGGRNQSLYKFAFQTKPMVEKSELDEKDIINVTLDSTKYKNLNDY